MLPAGDVGGVPFPVDGEPAGFFIIIDLVTLGSSTCSSAIKPKFNSSDRKNHKKMVRKTEKIHQIEVPLPEIERIEKDAGFRSLLRPVSGWGPATVSSQSLSKRPIENLRAKSTKLANGGREERNREEVAEELFIEGMKWVWDWIMTVGLNLDGDVAKQCMDEDKIVGMGPRGGWRWWGWSESPDWVV